MDVKITRNEIYKIFRDIVINYPNTNCRQLNTFASLFKSTDLNSPNLGKSYQDYKDGYFWSRAWVHSGASRDTIKGQYPLLSLENKEMSFNPCCNDEDCYEWHMLIIDTLECGNCEGCNRTKDSVYSNLMAIAKNVMCEFSSYKAYQDEEGAYWLSEGQAHFYNNNGSELSEACGEMCDMLDGEIKIEPIREDLIDGGIGVYLSFKTKHCSTVEKVDFNYDQKPLSEISKAICDVCN